MTFGHGGPADVDFSKTSFLVVDDKPFFRDMIHAALRGRTRALRDATTVERALEVLRHFGSDINCIISDWDMTPMGGLDLLRMVRSRVLPQVAPRTSYVILTSRADTGAVKCAIDLDVNGFALAPLSIEKLIKTIDSALHRTWMLRQPGHYAAVAPAVPAPLTHDVPASAPPQPAPRPHQSQPLGHALTNVRICGINAVQPGAILARDLRDPHGRVILATGTELSPNLIEQVRSTVDFLWVGETPPRA